MTDYETDTRECQDKGYDYTVCPTGAGGHTLDAWSSTHLWHRHYRADGSRYITRACGCYDRR